jgi:hypothetical protein
MQRRWIALAWLVSLWPRPFLALLGLQIQAWLLTFRSRPLLGCLPPEPTLGTVGDWGRQGWISHAKAQLVSFWPHPPLGCLPPEPTLGTVGDWGRQGWRLHASAQPLSSWPHPPLGCLPLEPTLGTVGDWERQECQMKLWLHPLLGCLPPEPTLDTAGDRGRQGYSAAPLLCCSMLLDALWMEALGQSAREGRDWMLKGSPLSAPQGLGLLGVLPMGFRSLLQPKRRV